MATITDPAYVKTLLTNRGVYPAQGEDPADPPAVRIYQYTNANSERVYAVFYRHQDDDLASSPFVGAFDLLLANGELTAAGRAWLDCYADVQAR